MESLTIDSSLDGDLLFASLDAEATTLTLNPTSGSLAGKKFAAFIKGDIEVDLEIQDPLSVILTPFMITVSDDL